MRGLFPLALRSTARPVCGVGFLRELFMEAPGLFMQPTPFLGADRSFSALVQLTYLFLHLLRAAGELTCNAHRHSLGGRWGHSVANQLPSVIAP
ncbi:hypothetical protein EES39_37250 [Streptomyces sp. ADI92-24]|nr:hypothetical protein EDD95_6207 [Streptomyces sp. CEV 2-1]RPK33384.1 hypothetical protein EES39_37250 [Streptomyces sp. ADI92-24]